MKGQFYIYDCDARGVGTITLNRPEIHNAFNDVLIEELIVLFNKLEKDDSVRLVALTGAGKSFCAGADLNWMKKMVSYSEAENIKDSERLATLFETMNEFPKPLLGKINGAALGGGTGLIACCDYAVACKSAKLGFTEVLLGLIPAVISPYVIAKIGESRARAYFLSGEIVYAEKALEWGLIHQICPLDDLDDSFSRVVDKFLKAGPIATKEAKALIKNILNLPQGTVTDYTCKAIGARRVSAEGQEGMTALLEKRKASWI